MRIHFYDYKSRDTVAFEITHVLILEGPPRYRAETRPFEGKLYPADQLPKGFTIRATYGDAFLMYRDDGTLMTACSRNFYQKDDLGCWFRWPFLDRLSPDDAWAEHKKDSKQRQNKLGMWTGPKEGGKA